MSEALNTDEVARKDFPVSFRGFDQQEVRSYLGRLAEAIASWHEREAQLLARIDELEHAPPAEFDEAALETALGRETTRVIQAAREAAAEIKANAEANYFARQKEADELLSVQRAELDKRASTVVEEARAKAKSMIESATSERDALLDDLAHRRSGLLAEIEQLHTARERLVQTFEDARAALERSLADVVHADEAAVELIRVPPASERADASPTAVAPVEPEPAPTAPEPAAEAPSSDAEQGPDPEPEPEPEPSADDERRTSALRLVRPAGAPVEPTGYTPVAPAVEDGVEGVRLIRPEPVPESEPEPEPEPAVGEEAAPEPEASAEPEAETEPDRELQPEPDAPVDGLFARLRADRAEKVATAEAILAGPLPEPDPEPASEPELATTAEADPALAPFAVRDAAVADAERGVVRSLKRALADEQNEVLDQLRRLKGKPALDALLPDVAVHDARYGAVLGTGATAAAGAAAADEGASGSAVATELGAGVAADLRLRIERAIDEASGDVDTLAEAISSAYREWKTARAEPLARDLITAGYAAGTYASAVGDLRWVVDPAEGGCPDCDDNALAGPIPKGTAFPTGQVHPPAHTGCRCLAVPAS